MSIEASAEALVSDASPVTQDTPPTEPEFDLDNALSEIYDSAQTEDDAPQEPQPEEPEQKAEPEEPEQKAEDEEPEASELAEAPTDLPRGVRDHWAKLPEEAREVFAQSYRDLTGKLRSQGREIQQYKGVAPVRDMLAKAAETYPHLLDMRPEQIGQEMLQLADISYKFDSDPVGTLLNLAKQHNITENLAQALTGGEVQKGEAQKLITEMKNEIGHLKRQLQQMSDPENQMQVYEQFSRQQNVMSTVQEFVSQAEHWDAVEHKMPAAIEFVRDAAGDNISERDILQRAYDLAVSQVVPEAEKMKSKAAETAPEVTDPEKTKAQIKAKSVNVRSKPSASSRGMTLDQNLDSVWQKHYS